MIPKLNNRQMNDLLQGREVEKGGIIFVYWQNVETVGLYIRNTQGDLEPIGTLYESWFFRPKGGKK